LGSSLLTLTPPNLCVPVLD
jgi:hypothetical protein